VFIMPSLDGGRHRGLNEAGIDYVVPTDAGYCTSG
jgi:hypothetical protein